MEHAIVLDPDYGFTVVGLLGLAIGLPIFFVRIFKVLYAIKKCHDVKKPRETASDWRHVEYFAIKRVVARLFMFVLLLVLFWILLRNAYLWFNSIQVTQSSFKLGYLLREDRILGRAQVVKVEMIQQKSGGHLEIVTTSGKIYRSVLITENSVSEKVAAFVQTK